MTEPPADRPRLITWSASRFVNELHAIKVIFDVQELSGRLSAIDGPWVRRQSAVAQTDRRGLRVDQGNRRTKKAKF
jgi:hypothetical protein